MDRTQRQQEIPSKYLIRSLKKARKNRKEGKVSPIFDNVKDAIRWLEDDHAKLQNGECVCGKKHKENIKL